MTALELGAFIEASDDIRGAFHDSLSHLLGQFEIMAHRFAKVGTDGLRNALRYGPAILSVDLNRIDPKLSGSHLIIVGETDADRFIIYDNARLLHPGMAHRRLSRAGVAEISNGKGLAITDWPH